MRDRSLYGYTEPPGITHPIAASAVSLLTSIVKSFVNFAPGSLTPSNPQNVALGNRSAQPFTNTMLLYAVVGTMM